MTAWEHGDEYPNDKLITEGGMKKRERALWMWVGGGASGSFMLRGSFGTQVETR